MIERFQNHPGLRRADAVLGVPANPPKDPHNLPELLADRLGTSLGIASGRGILIKEQPTVELKNLPDPDKLAALDGKYRVARDLRSKSIILVDDLVYSGTTLSFLGQLLKDYGAGRVIGLAATKTRRT